PGQIERPPWRRGPASRVTVPVQDWIRQQIRKQPDVTLMELQQGLQAGQGLGLSIGKLWLALQQMRLRLKKSHSMPRNRETPEGQRRRQAWREAIGQIDPAQLVFLDESGASTQMTRNYGRAARGQRVREATPSSHWRTLTMLAALTREGLQAPMTIESATDGD